MEVLVLERFMDKYDHRVYYSPGDVINIDDMDRVKDLVTRKPKPLVKLISEEVVVDSLNLDQSVAKIKEEILTISDISVLNKTLEKELSDEKPRKGVISAINDRIEQL